MRVHPFLRVARTLLAACLLLAARVAAAAGFDEVEAALAERLTDVQSVVVLQRGRVVYQFHRDGQPDRLRDVQSVEKSALAVLVGIALRKGELRGLDVPVVELVPQWKDLNDDPRAAQVTVRHLLTMTAGFDPGRGERLPPQRAWQRRMLAAPGERFGYDNATSPLLAAVLEEVSGLPLPDYARRELVQPLGVAEPRYGHTLWLRTEDMAKLGQLMLQQGRWGTAQLLAPDYVQAAGTVQNDGGAPVGLPYGYLWWVPRPGQLLASGWGGQMVWVHPASGVVIAMASSVTPASQQRGHALRLLRGGIVQAAQQAP